MDKKIIYYNDISDDFEEHKKEPIKIDSSYKYLHKNPLWNLISFVAYRIIATPIAYLFMRIRFNFKIVNKNLLKQANGQGYFIYSNHTQLIGDAFAPTLINFPKKTYVVVHPYNVSIPFWGNIIKLLGPLPVPDDLDAGRNFFDAMKKIIARKQSIVIYPEAHVWSYYTKIREFDESSFKYPVKLNVPVYTATTTYKERKNKVPQIVTYIDGPFYPEGNSTSEKKKSLKNIVLEKMQERAKCSDTEYIKYIKNKENVDD